MEPDTIERLADVLTQSEKRYDALLGLLQRERDAAIHSDAGQLTEVVEQKAEVLAMLASLEKKRGRLLQTIAGELHIPRDQLTLSRIALSLPVESSGQIRRLSISLRSLAINVQRANDENRRMVRHCLDLVSGALGFFQQLLNPVSVYGSSGQFNKGAGSGRLLSGII